MAVLRIESTFVSVFYLKKILKQERKIYHISPNQSIDKFVQPIISTSILGNFK